jgi:hypothetical protein
MITKYFLLAIFAFVPVYSDVASPIVSTLPSASIELASPDINVDLQPFEDEVSDYKWRVYKTDLTYDEAEDLFLFDIQGLLDEYDVFPAGTPERAVQLEKMSVEHPPDPMMMAIFSDGEKTYEFRRLDRDRNFELCEVGGECFLRQRMISGAADEIYAAHTLNGKPVFSFFNEHGNRDVWYDGHTFGKQLGFREVKQMFVFEGKLGFVAKQSSGSFVYYDGKRVSGYFDIIRSKGCCALSNHPFSVFETGELLFIGKRDDTYYLAVSHLKEVENADALELEDIGFYLPELDDGHLEQFVSVDGDNIVITGENVVFPLIGRAIEDGWAFRFGPEVHVPESPTDQVYTRPNFQLKITNKRSFEDIKADEKTMRDVYVGPELVEANGYQIAQWRAAGMCDYVYSEVLGKELNLQFSADNCTAEDSSVYLQQFVDIVNSFRPYEK